LSAFRDGSRPGFTLAPSLAKSIIPTKILAIKTQQVIERPGKVTINGPAFSDPSISTPPTSMSTSSPNDSWDTSVCRSAQEQFRVADKQTAYGSTKEVLLPFASDRKRVMC
jgi:hypothetical protein